jgi:hypothetical protein
MVKDFPGNTKMTQIAERDAERRMAHPVSGECLQYMGSAQYPGRGWVHVFRHRQVPGSDQRQYWQVLASVGWQPVPPRQG